MAKDLFLYILRCSLKGEPLSTEKEISEEVWAQVFELARIHKVLPLIYDSAYHLLEERNFDTSGVRNLSRQMMIMQASKTSAFLTLLEKLERCNIPVTVVKGITCRRLYRNPDLRISSDEDLLLNPSDIKACEELLIKEGLILTTPDREDHYQRSYRRADGLHLEIHSSLFPNESYYKSWNKVFNNASKEHFFYENSPVRITTLSPTYNLLYLILHAMKHFINVGVGIRQICDIIIQIETYQKELDWSFIEKTLKELNALDFTKAILALAEEVLDFKLRPFLPEVFFTDAPAYKPLLEDILEGGVYGTSTLSRAHSRSFTENASKGKNTTFLSRAFPSPKSLKGKYKYAKNPLLLPVAYIHRIVNYSSEVLHTKNNTPLSSAKIGARRIELLRLYSILEK